MEDNRIFIDGADEESASLQVSSETKEEEHHCCHGQGGQHCGRHHQEKKPHHQSAHPLLLDVEFASQLEDDFGGFHGFDNNFDEIDEAVSDQLSKAILKAASRVIANYDVVHNEKKVNRAMVLAGIDHLQQCSIDALYDMVELDKEIIDKALIKLIKKGRVGVIETSEGVEYALTDSGLQYLEDYYHLMDEVDIYANFNNDDALDLLELLNKIK